MDNDKFSDLLKFSLVNPIFKKGCSEELINYRPIAILPTFSKIYEKVLYFKIMLYLNNYKLFYPFQFGF